jgi:iduronate 2-sulfatase
MRLAMIFCWLPIALLYFPGEVRGDQPPRKPNVLFVVVDDLNTSIGCYGHPLVKTPSLDRLAARGMRFDRAYCQYPLCNPSRTSFLSGRRPETTKDFGNGQPVAEMLARLQSGEIVFLPEYFRRHGYFVAGVNKIMHNYDHAVKWDFYKHLGSAKSKGLAQLGGRLRQTDQNDAETEDGKAARVMAEVLEKPRDQPFFMAIGFHKPHHPFVAPKQYFDMYAAEKITLPQGLPEKKLG